MYVYLKNATDEWPKLKDYDFITQTFSEVFFFF